RMGEHSTTVVRACYNNCHALGSLAPVASTYAPSSPLVMAWATTQSQMFFVYQYSQTIRLNQTRAAKISGWERTGNKIAAAAASGVTLPIGTFHQSRSMTKRITKPL